MAVEPNPTYPEPDVLTVQELAERLGMGLTTAYQMARANTLPVPALRIGREYRFSRRALERWLDGETAPGSGNAA